MHGLTLQDNVFDHDGWNYAAGAWMTMYNHDCYVTALCSGLTATDNIFANASNFGLEARCGGNISSNLFYNDANGLCFGLVKRRNRDRRRRERIGHRQCLRGDASH